LHRYAKDPEENPVCLPCFNDKYAVQCGTCKNVISAGERAMKAGENSYCDTKKCFACTKCKRYLGDQKVVQFQDDLYCSPCYKEVHSPPCACCGEQIHGEFVEVRGKRYRKSCFKCAECGAAFTREEKKGAYPIGEKLLCYTHALTARRKELKAAKAAAAEKEREDEEARQKEQAAAAPTTSPSIMISEEPEPETVNATTGGAEVVSAPTTSNIVRQGTKRVSRMARKPSLREAPTAEEKAAAAKAVQEAESFAEADEDESVDESSINESVLDPANLVSATAAGGVAAASVTRERPAHQLSAEEQDAKRKSDMVDPYAAMWAGFSIPMKLSKFKMDVAGREVLEVGQFTLIEKKFMAKVGCIAVCASPFRATCALPCQQSMCRATVPAPCPRCWHSLLMLT
jgi:hypothetical protein